jgi:Ran GTPase-activating protein (RanGAP) involved in mRNA processing and transport
MLLELSNYISLTRCCCCCCVQGLLLLAAAPSIRQLLQLDLSHNELGPAAEAGLAQLLQKAASLQVLKLSSTQLQDEGGSAFLGFIRFSYTELTKPTDALLRKRDASRRWVQLF